MRFDFKRAIVTNWPMKLTALALASVLWAAVAAEEPTTELVPVMLRVDPPQGRTLTQPLPPVQALYSGASRELIKLYSVPPLVHKVIPDTITSSSLILELAPQDVVVSDDADVTLQDVRPRRILVVLDSIARRTVPVAPRVTAVPDSGYVLVGNPVVSPGSVVVVGPEAQVRRIGTVFTQPLNLLPLRSPVRRTVALDTSALGVVRVSQPEVDIVVNVTPMEQRLFVDVPVTVNAVNTGWTIVPPTVLVTVRGPRTRLESLARGSVVVTTAPVSGGDSVTAPLNARVPTGLTASVSPDSALLIRRSSGRD
jgi:hypothetical protein